MAETESEKLLAEIGGLLMEGDEYPSEPTLLYAQLDHNMTGQSIFKELGNQLLFRWPVNERLTIRASRVVGGSGRAGPLV